MKKIIIVIIALMTYVGANAQGCGECKKYTHCNDSAAVVNTMLTRRSVRKYKDTPVRRDQMDQILNCGINAPSGMNRQPWEIRVVDNPEFLKGITEAWKKSLNPEMAERMASGPNFKNMFRNGPTVVFIATKDGKSQMDAGILAENMVITAWSMGIGSCIQGGPVGFVNSEAAKEYLKKLDFSEGYKLVLAISFGYPDEAPAAKPRDASKVKYIGR